MSMGAGQQRTAGSWSYFPYKPRIRCFMRSSVRPSLQWGGCAFVLDANNSSIGRFEFFFLVHMIKDFFLVLLAVRILEFALKAAAVYFNYSVHGASEAQVVADELVENVRSIMRNEGGPVAARTIYPILERNWTDLGYAVAIVPSDVTIRSIRDNFDFVLTGIPEAGLRVTSRRRRSRSLPKLFVCNAIPRQRLVMCWARSQSTTICNATL